MSLWVTVLVLAVLAAARVTRLVVGDTITFPLRDWAARHDHGPRTPVHWLHGLITCPWCFGFWVCLAAVLVAWQIAPHPVMPSWFAVPAETLAASYLVGLVAGWEGGED